MPERPRRRVRPDDDDPHRGRRRRRRNNPPGPQWTWPTCEWRYDWLFTFLAWLAGLPGSCFGWVSEWYNSLRPQPPPEQPLVVPRSITPPAYPRPPDPTWYQRLGCTCRCELIRSWGQAVWTFIGQHSETIWNGIRQFFQIVWRLICRCFRAIRSFKAPSWPEWEPDQESLAIKVMQASRLEGLKLATKKNMHFAGRILYFVSYKIFAFIGIYMSIVGVGKYLTNPIVYKDAGNIPIENIPFMGVDVYSSHIYTKTMLQEIENLFETAKELGNATDSFGDNWTFSQMAKLVFYVFSSCQAGQTHSIFMGAANLEKSLNMEGIDFDFKEHLDIRDDPKNKDYKKIKKFISKHNKMKCANMLKACRWGPEGIYECSDIFYTVESESGTSCRFNLIPEDELKLKRRKSAKKQNKSIPWNIDYHQFFRHKSPKDGMNEFPYFQKNSGRDFGLTFVLVMETQDLACPRNEGNAYMVTVHSPLDRRQPISNGILIPPNHEVNINVKADITLSENDIINISEDSRQCYFQKEKMATNYTENNCRSECRSNLIKKMCDCHKIGTTEGANETICGPQHAKCLKEVEGNITEKGYSEMCLTLDKPLKCYHGCTDIVYTTDVSSTPYSGPLDLLGIIKVRADQATAVVRISFASDSFPGREREGKYDIWEIIGIIGGFLSLMIGVDCMSVIHLIYSFGVWVKGMTKGRDENNSPAVPAPVPTITPESTPLTPASDDDDNENDDDVTPAVEPRPVTPESRPTSPIPGPSRPQQPFKRSVETTMIKRLFIVPASNPSPPPSPTPIRSCLIDVADEEELILFARQNQETFDIHIQDSYV